MGKQNFIQGGFKGRVGNVIGAGWKDMLTIRTYTKPKNPRTQEQRKVRNAFALKVQASQLANLCNYGSPLFESSSNTSWALRMAAASKLYATDANILEYVPLIPYGYSPDYPTSDAPTVASNVVTLAWNTEDDISARAVRVLIYALNTDTSKYDTIILDGTVSGNSGAWSCSVSVPATFEIDENSYCTAVSIDDAEHSNTTLYQPPINLGVPLVDLPFTLSLASDPAWSSGSNYVIFTFTPSETLPDFTNVSASSSAYAVLQGDFVTDTGSAAVQSASNVVSIAVPITLDSLGQRPLFVTGSSVTIGAFSYISNGYRYQFAGATYSLAETATQQTLVPASTRISNQGGQLVWTIKSNVSAASTVSTGSFSCSSVVRSSLSTETLNYTIAPQLAGPNLRVTSSSAGTIYWGSEQAVTNYVAPVVQINGVNYAISASAPTVMPYMTYTKNSITPSSSNNAMFLANSDNGFFSVDFSGSVTPQIQLEFVGEWWDSIEMSWDDISMSVSDAKVYINGNEGTYFASGLINFTYPSTSQNDATFTISNSSEKDFQYIVPNSDGFVYHLAIKAFSAAWTCTPS